MTMSIDDLSTSPDSGNGEKCRACGKWFGYGDGHGCYPGITTQPPHQDRGEVSGHVAMLRSLRMMYADGVMDAEDHPGTLSALDAAIAALTEAKQQGPEEVLARGWFHALPEDDYEFHDDASGAGKNYPGCIRAMIVREAPQVEAKRQTGGDHG